MPEKIEEFRGWLVNEAIFAINGMRRRLSDWMQPNRRDLEKECGHPSLDDELSDASCWKMWRRFTLAKRVNNIYADSCWEVSPQIYDSERQSKTAFVKSFVKLGRSLSGGPFSQEERHPLWNVLKEADIKMGIGRFGIIVLGLSDSLDLSQPITRTVGLELKYMQAFSSAGVEIEENANGITKYSVKRESGKHIDIHPSRVVHLSESGGLFHESRMLAVWDHLLALRKLYLSSPEGYWRGNFPGISIEGDPAMAGVPLDEEKIKQTMQDYFEGLNRGMFWMGAKAKSLAPAAIDPSPFIDRQIDAICIEKDVPKRIFMGSERGELASSTDQSQWNEKITGYRNGHCCDRVIFPVISRLIDLGILVEPKNDLMVWWPSVEMLSDQEKALTSKTITESLVLYLSLPIEVRANFPFDQFLIRVMKFTEEEVKSLSKIVEQPIPITNPVVPNPTTKK